MNEYLEFQVAPEMIAFFRKQAEQKIAAEGWGKQGRNVAVKVDNFVHCWTTEEAFKQLLIKKGIWFRNRGLYFGDSAGAGADFVVKVEGKEVSVGLRSVAPESLSKWKQVAYPDDRIRLGEKIADYHIVCNHDNGYSRFFGVISREELLAAVSDGKRLYSKNNQEYFRVIPLEKFRFSVLVALVEKMERV
ncbi:MAG: hypothetical protein KKH52_01840 [Nanoarchaeota archaeon]|nr:hypothetical protein [Nanoarchaeota archaeon]MBU1622330.1 hypothetical protein [Nanoarchaeota archaeon]MBU1974113.1 hypothetical protein [Nanoarchaeota archaeon]